MVSDGAARQAGDVNNEMRVISQEVLGGPEVLNIAAAPVPAPGPSQVVVRVEATSLNPTDWVHRRIEGFLGDGPRVLGWDVAGTVVEVGLGVTVHRPGDRVFGMLPYPFGHGAVAEFVRAPARALAPIPDDVDTRDAGVIPLVGLTAWQALVDTAHVGAGDRVLIHAAAGGVGHVATQIAKAHGAYVIGTASARNHAMVLGLGADEVIDYSVPGAVESIHDIDIVIDTIGGTTAARSLGAVRRGGSIVSLALNTTSHLGEAAREAGVAHHLMLVEDDHHSMKELSHLLASGALRPVIDREVHAFDIDAFRSAHAHGDAGHVAGKIAVRVG